MSEKHADQSHIDRLKAIRKQLKEKFTADYLFQEIRKGNRQALSKGITLAESKLDTDRKEAQKLINKCLPFTGKSIRIGITGVPGVGKSTFIESFGQQITENGHQVAVLAIDPSSEKSSGSILGDKTRMEQLTQNPNAFIRPTATGNNLGGVARMTRESILLCEAAGFDVILIETVGVGQSETTVNAMVDFFLLLMLSGAGDELQGIKRGIMEMADALVITKCDGDNIKASNNARQEYQNAMHLFPANSNGWVPKALTSSSYENRGMDKIWDLIQKFNSQMLENGWLHSNRIHQKKYWLHETIKEELIHSFYNNEEVKKSIAIFENKLAEQEMNPFQVAEQILKKYNQKK